jgi:6-phosphogluconolactonase
VRTRGSFTVALAGGRTPRALYGLLAGGDGRAVFRSLIDWDKVQVYWGDERHVPPDHVDSNYRMAHETLLSKVPVPAGNVHRIRAEEPDAAGAAEDYERTLRTHLRLSPGQPPRFDLVLLGMGADGHTASLFPGSEALREAGRLVAAPWVEALKTHRITLTPVAFNGAACILFLVSGPEKAGMLRAVLEGPLQPDLLPAQAIRPARGSLVFIVDRPAAGLLTAAPR